MPTYNMDDDTQWYAMRDLTRPNAKVSAYEKLNAKGIRCFTPMVKKQVKLRGDTVLIDAPYMRDLLFAYGTRRVRLVTIGFIQYVSPTMTFVLGTFLYREPMSWDRLAAFGLVWCAIALYLADAALAARRERAAAANRSNTVTFTRTNLYKK